MVKTPVSVPEGSYMYRHAKPVPGDSWDIIAAFDIECQGSFCIDDVE
jgi:hypothetical protein